jgi:hypothetical protein
VKYLRILTNINPRSAIRSPEEPQQAFFLQLKKMPVVLGEVDVIKSLLLLPSNRAKELLATFVVVVLIKI